MKEKNMKAIIYGRQSSGDDDKSESIEIQIENCQHLAAEKNIQVVGIYQDLNSSGKLYPSGYELLSKQDYIFQQWLKTVTTRKENRPGLGKVFSRLKDIDYIIVDDFTRLARPISGSFLDAIITQELTANNVKVLTVKQGEIDITSFNDGLITTLQNRINDKQLAIQRKKSMDGLKKLKDAGINRQGISRVLGFKPTGRKHEIEIVPREREAIEYIYQAFLDGHNINGIVKVLNSTFADVWDHGKAQRNMVLKTLKRPFYSGYMFNSEGELIVSEQTKNLAFIPFSTWKKVNEILAERKVTNPRPKRHFNPFVGKIFCGKCGAREVIRGGSDQRKTFFACLEHLVINKESCKCNMARSNSNDYGVGLIEAIRPLLVIGALKKLEELHKEKNNSEQISELNIQLENIKNKELKLNQMWMENLIDDNTYTNNIRTLADQKKKLNAELLSLNAVEDNEETEEQTNILLRKIVAGNISNGEYEDLVRRTIKRINIFDDHIHVITICGDIDIPKQSLRIYKLLPHYFFRSNGRILYYYLGKKKPMVNVYGEYISTTKLGPLTVHLIK
jgi:DNA invertase Pin-like site-specific DNA recombinase